MEEVIPDFFLLRYHVIVGFDGLFDSGGAFSVSEPDGIPHDVLKDVPVLEFFVRAIC